MLKKIIVIGSLFSSIYLVDNFPGVEIQFLLHIVAIQTINTGGIFEVMKPKKRMWKSEGGPSIGY